MKYFTLLLISMILARSVNAALLPSSESSNAKVLPGSSSSGNLLPGSSTSTGKVLPSSGSNGAKILPSPANSTGGGDFFVAPTNVRLTKLVASDTGDNSKATREIGEPLHGGYAGNPGGKSLWWRFESHFNGLLLVSTAGSNFDTVLGIYIGDTVSGLTALASDNNSGPNKTSMATVRVFSGSVYYIAVDGYNGASGKIKLNIVGAPTPTTTDGRPFNDDYADRVGLGGNYVIDYGNNYGATGEPEDVGFFDSSVQNVWWSWTAPLNGKVTFKTAGSDFDTVLYVYRRDSLGNLINTYIHDDVNIRTDRSSLIVVSNVTPGEIFDIAVDGFAQGEGFIVLSVNQQPNLTTPANDAFDFRIGAKGSSYSFATTTANATLFEVGEPVHAGVSISGTIWWTWTAPDRGILTVSAKARPASGTTAASPLKPVIAVYKGASVSTLVTVASAVDSDVDGNTELSLTTVKGQIYQIVVANGTGAAGAFTFALDYATGAPVIATQPVSLSVSVGEAAIFTVGVTATTLTPVTYSWERRSGKVWAKITDGSIYTGTTQSSLKILSATSAMNGAEFRCVITNSAGTATSNTVTLTVVLPLRTAKKTSGGLLGH